MQIHHIEVRTHGRYLVDRPAGDGLLPVLVGFHGYGENAEHMLEALMRIRGARKWLLVSVQALNRFYNRSSGTVVANWMTREDRELAIEDNIAYVRSVVAAVRAADATNEMLVYSGFSQGVAMAYRAAAFGERANGIVVLAGDVPPDVAPQAGRLPPILIGRGAADDWYTEAKAAADLQVLRAAKARFDAYVFDAGHVWDESFIVRAGAFLDSLTHEHR